MICNVVTIIKIVVINIIYIIYTMNSFALFAILIVVIIILLFAQWIYKKIQSNSSITQNNNENNSIISSNSVIPNNGTSITTLSTKLPQGIQNGNFYKCAQTNATYYINGDKKHHMISNTQSLFSINKNVLYSRLGARNPAIVDCPTLATIADGPDI